MMGEDIKRVSASDAGCWVDGHWGQYGVARLCQIALELGWDDSDALSLPFAIQYRATEDLVAQKLASIGPSETEDLTLDEDEALTQASDDAEAWLNEHVAPEGYSFGWYDGEFFLWSDTEWEMEDAVERLREKLAKLEAKREAVKDHNKRTRKVSACQCGDACACRDKWSVTRCGCKEHPLPSYALTNLSGQISQVRQRIERLS